MVSTKSIILGVFTLSFLATVGYSGEYYPISQGAIWKFRSKDGKTITQKVVQEEKIGFYQTFLMETAENGKTISSEHLGETPEGMTRFSLNGNRFEKPVLILKANTKAGDHWEILMDSAKGQLKGVIQVSTEEVVVPAGKYPCQVTTIASTKEAKENFQLKIAYAPKIGPVRVEYRKGDLGAQILELVEFSSVPAAKVENPKK